MRRMIPFAQKALGYIEVFPDRQTKVYASDVCLFVHI